MEVCSSFLQIKLGPFFFSNVFTLKVRVAEKSQKERKMFHPLVYISDGSKDLSWAGLKNGASNYICVSGIGCRKTNIWAILHCFSSGHYEGIGMKVKGTGHDLVLIWDAGVAGYGSSCYVTCGLHQMTFSGLVSQKQNEDTGLMCYVN